MRKLFLLAALTGLTTSAGFGAIIDFKNVANGVFSTGVESNVLLRGQGLSDQHYTLIAPAGCTAGNVNCQEDGTVGNMFGPASYVVLGGPEGTPNSAYPFAGPPTGGPACRCRHAPQAAGHLGWGGQGIAPASQQRDEAQPEDRNPCLRCLHRTVMLNLRSPGGDPGRKAS